MSARDSASGSSDWKGGGGGMTANGGIGGGMGGGLGGGGAGRNGGYGSASNSGGPSGGGAGGGLAAAVVPVVRKVKQVFTPPPVRYKKAVSPPAVAAPALTKTQMPMFFGGTPTVTPVGISLASPKAKQITDRAPVEENFPGNSFDTKTRQVGQGKTYTDRVPQGSGFAQSGSRTRF